MGERRRPERVIVVGAGVSGLTCGIALLREGVPVTIVAAEFCDDETREEIPEETREETSERPDDNPPPSPSSPWAAAVWYPYLPLDLPESLERAREWGKITREVLTDLAADRPESGVSMISLDVHLGPDADKKERENFDPGELEPLERRPFPGCVNGMCMRVPLMDAPRYLGFLAGEFRGLGGTMKRMQLESLELPEPLGGPGVTVVNCSGLGARALSPETGTGKGLMKGVRGQVLRVRLEPPIERCSVALRDGGAPPVYVFPRGDECVLGGTYEKEKEERELPLSGPGEGPPLPDEERIVRECVLLEPDLEGRLQLGTARRGAGLRPVRGGGIRLERETRPGGGDVVHNYGHGGAGFTVAWGCAAEVVRLVLGRETDPAG